MSFQGFSITILVKGLFCEVTFDDLSRTFLSIQQFPSAFQYSYFMFNSGYLRSRTTFA